MPRAFISIPQGNTSTSKFTPSLERLLRSHSIPQVHIWHLWQGLTEGEKRRRQQARNLRSASSFAAPQQDSPEAAKPVQPNLSVSDCPPGYQIRSAKAEEAYQIAALNAEAFAWTQSDRMEPGFFKSYTEQAEAFYQQSVYQDSISQLTKALSDKQQAGRGSREATLRQQSRKLRADIAHLQGQPIPALPLEDRLQKVAMQSWRRKRQFLCLVVEHRSSKQVVASCVLSLAAPDALLPAPFPTTKPWRLYCSNMAVATAHRRQGLATALLHRCQRIGALWGHSEMWLHVDVINEQAQKLYLGSGFGIKSRDSWYYIIGRKRYLMQKALTDRSRKTRAKNAVRLAGGSIRGSDGVFVWDVQPDANVTAAQASSSDADS
ncbi:hypothetical protein WJX77_002185 [Trebouxia sp. C0004]